MVSSEVKVNYVIISEWQVGGLVNESKQDANWDMPSHSRTIHSRLKFVFVCFQLPVPIAIQI